jgi:hypothetical protein
MASAFDSSQGRSAVGLLRPRIRQPEAPMDGIGWPGWYPAAYMD